MSHLTAPVRRSTGLNLRCHGRIGEARRRYVSIRFKIDTAAAGKKIQASEPRARIGRFTAQLIDFIPAEEMKSALQQTCPHTCHEAQQELLGGLFHFTM